MYSTRSQNYGVKSAPGYEGHNQSCTTIHAARCNGVKASPIPNSVIVSSSYASSSLPLTPRTPRGLRFREPARPHFLLLLPPSPRIPSPFFLRSPHFPLIPSPPFLLDFLLLLFFSILLTLSGSFFLFLGILLLLLFLNLFKLKRAPQHSE